MSGPTPTLASVRSVRDRIEATVSREQRVAILEALGCFEPAEIGGSRYRRATSPSASGAELLAAIDALDRACMQGGAAEIETTGAHLIGIWRRFR